MRICFTSDLHGHRQLYEQLEALLVTDRPHLLILGGDLFVDGDLDDPVGTQVRYVVEDFLPRLRRWRAATPRLQVVCILGNHDWLCTQRALRDPGINGDVILLDRRSAWAVGDLSFVGYSCTPPTPYWVKDFERLDLDGDELPDTGGAVWHEGTARPRRADPHDHFHSHPSMQRELREAAPVAGRWILVAHAPPHDSRLDALPHVPYPVGSRAVREFIATRQPLVSLHGHIHESPDVTGAYHTDIGSTLCINPGQSHARLRAVSFDSESPRDTLRHTVYS